MADRFKPCLVDGCNGNADRTARGAIGYCAKHLARFRAHGDPLGGGPERPPAIGPCSVDGCERQQYGRGLCNMHWQRWNKYGNTDGKQTPKGEPLKWLLAHVDYQGEDCLTWPYSRSDKGYGFVYYKRKVRQVSRVMAILAHGEPPSPDLEAAHNCGKGHEGCVNPKHLRWATPKENSADELIHGTRLRGSDKPGAKLTEEEVMLIWGLQGTDTQVAIGKRFGVGGKAISDIFRGDSWAWLTGAKPLSS